MKKTQEFSYTTEMDTRSKPFRVLKSALPIEGFSNQNKLIFHSPLSDSSKMSKTQNSHF